MTLAECALILAGAAAFATPLLVVFAITRSVDQEHYTTVHAPDDEP